MRLQHVTVTALMSIAILATVAMVAPVHGQERQGEPSEFRAERAGRRPGGGPAPGGDGPMRRMAGWMDELRQSNPEEFERLQQLREQDPDAFQREIRQRVRRHVGERFMGGDGEEDQACAELGKRYQEATGDEERTRIKAELVAAVQRAFDDRIVRQKEAVAAMQRRIDELEQRLAEREANREKVCAARLEELTRDPKLNW